MNGAGFANNTELTHCRFNDNAEDGNLESKDVGYHNIYFECHGKLIYIFFFRTLWRNTFLCLDSFLQGEDFKDTGVVDGE